MVASSAMRILRKELAIAASMPIMSNSKSSSKKGTWNSSTVIVESEYFCAAFITFQNTVAVPFGGLQGYQAVAFWISGDKGMFYKVRFLGSQDTLLDEFGKHFYYRCFIEGATDFISGNAKSLYQECVISVVRNAFAIAAQQRNWESEDTGFSFVNCQVIGSGGTSVYLGRAWGRYSRIIYAYTEFNINVTEGGWQDWGDTSRHNTIMFGEYENKN